jgi:hypothetical protein
VSKTEDGVAVGGGVASNDPFRRFQEFYELHGGAETQAKITQRDRAVDVFGLRTPDPNAPELSNPILTPLPYNMVQPGPSYSTAMPLATVNQLIRAVPSTRRSEPLRLDAGDPMPDFSIRGSNGRTVTLEELRGKPFALRLTRGSSGVI